MGHSHDHHHHHHHHNATGNIKTAFFLNFGFTILEIIGGFYTNSVAILSDALHDLGDSLSLGLSWYFQKLSTKKRNNSFTFGYKRFSIMGAVINALVLVVGSVLIIKEAIPRILDPVQPDTAGMMLFAVVGVLVNGAAVLKLRTGDSLNERVVSMHLLEDVLGWIAVMVGSIIMHFKSIPILDPILSLGIALFILINVYKSLKTAFKIILQATPENCNPEEIKTHLKAMEEVKDVHDIHVWTMDGNYNVLTTHIVLENSYNLKELANLKEKIRMVLRGDHIQHCTIEFETADEVCRHVDC